MNNLVYKVPTVLSLSEKHFDELKPQSMFAQYVLELVINDSTAATQGAPDVYEIDLSGFALNAGFAQVSVSSTPVTFTIRNNSTELVGSSIFMQVVENGSPADTFTFNFGESKTIELEEGIAFQVLLDSLQNNSVEYTLIFTSCIGEFIVEKSFNDGFASAIILPLVNKRKPLEECLGQ